MLPSAQRYLKTGGMSPGAAAYTTIASFLGGVIVIQVVSRFLHHCIPSKIVDCEHSHKDEGLEEGGLREEISHADGYLPNQQLEAISEATPLLYRADTTLSEANLSEPKARRATPLLYSRSISCDDGGPCFGYSNPCAQECLRGACRSSTKTSVGGKAANTFSHPSMARSFTTPFHGPLQGAAKGLDEESLLNQSESIIDWKDTTETSQEVSGEAQVQRIPYAKVKSNSAKQETNEDNRNPTPSRGGPSDELAAPHHHHIAKNAFLAIGLQTSIAIALHKLPEGFITFATNHANPKLGFLVFMALFIHNITEGYAMALPLYLALESRWKAIFWSSLLGGISQPLGAGIAALWFKIAGKTDMTPGETVYGCMFAVTAGVMTSVALQLFSESVDLTHNQGLCITFAFAGMGVMGMSFALTAS